MCDQLKPVCFFTRLFGFEWKLFRILNSIDTQINVRFEPDFRFSVSIVDMHMPAFFLPREREKAEPSFTVSCVPMNPCAFCICWWIAEIYKTAYIIFIGRASGDAPTIHLSALLQERHLRRAPPIINRAPARHPQKRPEKSRIRQSFLDNWPRSGDGKMHQQRLI